MRAGNGLDSNGAGHNVDPSIAALTSQVAELSKLLHKTALAGGQQITIATGRDGHHRGGFLTTWVGLAITCAASAVAITCFRFLPGFDLPFTGWFVSRNVLRQSLSSVGASIESLSSRLSSVRASLTARADAMAARQDELKGSVDDLGAQVDAISRDIHLMGHGLGAVDAKLDDLAERQQFANKGIFLLCRIVTGVVGQKNGNNGASAGLPGKESAASALDFAELQAFLEAHKHDGDNGTTASASVLLDADLLGRGSEASAAFPGLKDLVHGTLGANT
mmetsp:Transcript_149/g.266  ORF Transcript_149/g.266 Transcript_149/m.266 type:complete len:278 (-) Transcript_149:273-1106(-)